MSQFHVEVKGQVHDWMVDEPLGAENFGPHVEDLMKFWFDWLGFAKRKGGYSDLQVDITEDGFAEEHNWEGTIGCMIYGVDISFDIDLSVYEMTGIEVDGVGGLSWDILSPAFSLLPVRPLIQEFEMPEDYMELKKMHPPINERVVISRLIKYILENSLQDYDGNTFDYWDSLDIEITPSDTESFGGFEYFINWTEDPFEEVKG